KVPDSYRRYLENVFREVFKLQGTPLRIQFKITENPYMLENSVETPKRKGKTKDSMSGKTAKRRSGKPSPSRRPTS
ncbi:MAG: ribosome biogenesis GTPase Der, partial [Candidatus Accumulibacter sp.]|nr:ribosome biogenesis GTPase Der [Accumulibacter sp.]